MGTQTVPDENTICIPTEDGGNESCRTHFALRDFFSGFSVSLSSRMRASSFSAGLSLGPCSTSSPLKAFANKFVGA